MISPSYNIKEFVEAIKDEDYVEVIRQANLEVGEPERRSFGVKGAIRARQQGSVEYAAVLKGFLFFMQYGVKPAGVTDSHFQLFHPVCENLVQKGQLKPGILNFFEQE